MRVRALQNLWLDGAAHCVGSVIDAAPECADRLLGLGLVEAVSEKSQDKVQEKSQEKSRKKKK